MQKRQKTILVVKLFVGYFKMSKLGKKPILLPKDSTVKVDSGSLLVSGNDPHALAHTELLPAFGSGCAYLGE